MHLRWMTPGAAAVFAALLVMALFAAALVLATTGRSSFEVGLPLGGGHRLMAIRIPCSATHAGRLIVGRDLFVSSRFARPALNVPISPPCP